MNWHALIVVALAGACGPPPATNTRGAAPMAPIAPIAPIASQAKRPPVVIQELGICNRSGWCWQNPLPQGHDLHGGIVIGEDLYAVGDRSVVMRFDGQRWERLDDGSLGLLYDIWGTSRSDLYVTSNGGKIRHFDGKEWTVVRATGEFLHFWASGPKDLIAVGVQGQVARWDGRAWSSQSTEDRTSTLFGVDGGGPKDVYAVGQHGMEHWNGAKWEPVKLPAKADDHDFKAVSVAGDYVATATRDGAVFVRERGRWKRDELENVRLTSVLADPSGEILVAGEGELVMRRRGGTWTEENKANYGGGTGLVLVRSSASLASTPVYAVGNQGRVLRRDNGAWRELSSGLEARKLLGIHGAAADNVWAVGERGLVVRYDGRAWKPIPSGAPTSSVTLRGVWVGSQVLAVGGDGPSEKPRGVIHRLDRPDAPRVHSTDRELEGIWGSSAADVWAVGKGGTLLHYDGATWSSREVTKKDLHTVWGRDKNDVWIAGDAIILRFDGKTWTTLKTLDDNPGGRNMDSIAACGDVTFVGGGRRLFRFDGRGVHEHEGLQDTFNRLTGRYVRSVVCGRDADDVRVLSNSGAVLRPGNDPADLWSNVEAAGYESVNAVWVSDGSGVWAVGEHGLILHGPRSGALVEPP